jgi:hypothetical protein
MLMKLISIHADVTSEILKIKCLYFNTAAQNHSFLFN